MRRPSISIVVPLVDERDHARECLEHLVAQDAAAEFEVLLVAADGDRDAPALAAALRPGDRVVACTGGDEIVYYAAGAAAARGEVLLFTEMHCLLAPPTVAAVAARFADPATGAAWIGSRSLPGSPVAELETALYRWEAADRPVDDDWRRVSLRGFAVRADRFRQAGGFVERHGRFAEATLALRLQELGVQLRAIGEPLVGHGNCRTFGELSTALRAHGRGQAAYRDDCERAGRGSVLPPLREWSSRALTEPAVARLLLREAWLGLLLRWRPRGRRERMLHGLRRLPALAAAALLGPRPKLLAKRAAAGIAALRCRLANAEDVRFLRYLEAWTGYVRCGALEQLVADPSARMAPPVSRSASAAEIADGSLAGFYAVEQLANGSSARWSSPLAALRLGLGDDVRRIELEVESPVPVGERALRASLGGRRVTVAVDRAHFPVRLRIEVPAGVRGATWLTLACTPLPGAAAPDWRPFGLCLRRVRLAG